MLLHNRKMPSKPVDYSKTIIYKLVCKDTSVTDCYVGQTRDMRNRRYRHKASCTNEKNKDHNSYVYKFIRDNGGWCNWQMLQIEHFPCADRAEADCRERYFIETLNAGLNTVVPGRTGTEYRKVMSETINARMRIYSAANKETLNEKSRIYREKNIETLNQKAREYFHANKETINEKKRIYREKNIQAMNKRQCEYNALNRDAINKRQRDKRLADPEAFKQRAREYKEANREAFNERRRQWTYDNRDRINKCRRERKAEKRELAKMSAEDISA